MNITSDNLRNLKCSECGEYLSRIPIYLKEDGSAICGRCPLIESEQNTLFRMKPYEDLIQNIIFPCMYKKNGCGEQLLSTSLQIHEENCKYRQIICPILTGTCDWNENVHEFYEHCQTEHSECIIKHPCVFQHNIARDCLKTCVTKVSNFLFLIHTKVSMTTHKIYYSVHYLDTINVSNMYYNMIIQKGDDKVIKRGKIHPLGCKMIKENLSVSCGINSIIEIFGGFDEVNFTIEIICVNQCKICNFVSDDLIEGIYCEHCHDSFITCGKDCSYKDIEVKMDRHRRYLCKFSCWCWICECHLALPPFLTNHYKESHQNVTYMNNVYWSSEHFARDQFDFLIDCNYGVFYCTLLTLDTNFMIEICSATLNTIEMCKLKCVLSIRNRGEIEQIPLVFQFNHKIDWVAKFPKQLFLHHNSLYEIKIDISKK